MQTKGKCTRAWLETSSNREEGEQKIVETPNPTNPDAAVSVKCDRKPYNRQDTTITSKKACRSVTQQHKDAHV